MAGSHYHRRAHEGAQLAANEAAKVIRDLLVIAKVAMPHSLYTEDPRVLTAIAAVKVLETGLEPSRPPNVTSRGPALDLATFAGSRPVETSAAGVSVIIDLPWDIVEPLTAVQAEEGRLDVPETVNLVLRDWLIAHGYLDAPGDDLT